MCIICSFLLKSLRHQSSSNRGQPFTSYTNDIITIILRRTVLHVLLLFGACWQQSVDMDFSSLVSVNDKSIGLTACVYVFSEFQSIFGRTFYVISFGLQAVARATATSHCPTVRLACSTVPHIGTMHTKKCSKADRPAR